jgi:hypothetical protein
MTYQSVVAGLSPVRFPLPHRQGASSHPRSATLSRAEVQRIIAEMLG